MSEPTRPIRQPTVDTDGSLLAHTVATPKSFKVRAKVTVGSRKVIPVIFVPGIMGTNLRARSAKSEEQGAPSRGSQRRGEGQAPGEPELAKPERNLDADVDADDPAWRAPNGVFEGLREARKWKRRTPATRQRILNPAALEVDGSGELGEIAGLSQAELRARGWGEIHKDSYWDVLEKLQTYLDTTFRIDKRGEREIRVHWKRVMQCSPTSWGVRSIARVTEAELEKFSGFQYPVYAVGYNWLESCAVSAQRLSRRIDEIKAFWRSRKHECERVILITHSMGGLVARACARLRANSPTDSADIAGIIHGVMPALGAPVAYRRIACGTESERYTNDFVNNVKANRFAEIAGMTASETTAVMATAPGALELLPNHLYPKPWLLVKTLSRVDGADKEQQVLALPAGNPYDLYRDMESWYRLIDPGLADPAGLFKGKPGAIREAVRKAIDTAEHFHRTIIGTGVKSDGAESKPYYHPNTFAFYGVDEERRTYGTVRWATRVTAGQGIVLTPANTRNARLVAQAPDGAREVVIEGRVKLRFSVWGQDAHGDDTVPGQSSAGVAAHVREVYASRGFGHQDSFSNDAMLLLTRHLIVKIVQGIK
ncbi:esterase/lipase family protein [Telluria sp. B2]